MEVFITFLAGFSLGWASAWIARTLPFQVEVLQEIAPKTKLMQHSQD